MKEIVINLLQQNKISPELAIISEDVLSRLQKSIVVSDREELVEHSTVLKIYTRREENLRRQGVKCAGLVETLAAIRSNEIQFKIVVFANEDSMTTIFISRSNDYVLGMFYMPIDKKTFNRIKP